MSENNQQLPQRQENPELLKLLEQWNLRRLYHNCLANNLTPESLRFMTPHFMEKFFTIEKIDLGAQIIFSHHLEKWQKIVNKVNYVLQNTPGNPPRIIGISAFSQASTPKVNNLTDTSPAIEKGLILPNEGSSSHTSTTSKVNNLINASPAIEHLSSETSDSMDFEDTVEPETIDELKESIELNSQEISSQAPTVDMSLMVNAESTSSAIQNSNENISYGEKNKKQVNYCGPVTVREILSASKPGRLILNLGREKQPLTASCRKMIVDQIITHIISNEIVWGIKLAEALSTEIRSLFPLEAESYYFMKKPGGAPLGALYIKYYNAQRKLKKSGLRVTRKYTPKGQAKPEVTITKEMESEVKDNLRKISNIKGTWEDLELNWEQTCKYRIAKISNAGSVEEIFREWKHYKYSMGYKLIAIDFKYMHPSATCLYSKYVQYEEQLLKVLQDQVKNDICKKILENFLEIEDPKTNLKSCTIFYVIHAVLIPRTKNITIVNNKKVFARYSIKDSQDSFIIFFETLNELEESTKYANRPGNNTSPVILIVGSIIDIKDIFVSFNGTNYAVNTFLEAVDISFMIYMVFNLKFPTESSLVWNFIQKFFYNLDLPNDTEHPAINILIHNIKAGDSGVEN